MKTWCQQRPASNFYTLSENKYGLSLSYVTQVIKEVLLNYAILCGCMADGCIVRMSIYKAELELWPELELVASTLAEPEIRKYQQIWACTFCYACII
jgi:hypothetical protein